MLHSSYFKYVILVIKDELRDTIIDYRGTFY